MPHRCIVYPEIELTSGPNGTDSKAHVIPSALGGRLRPTGILSRKANRLLNDRADLPLIQAFSDLMALIGGEPDRKGSGDKGPSLRMTDEGGRTYVVRFGENLGLTRPEFSMDDIGDGSTLIQLEARTPKEARTLLGQVKARYPEFDIEEALQKATVAHTWPEGRLHGRFEIGPRRVFPGVFAAASVFAAFHRQVSHHDLKAYFENLNVDAPVMPPDTFYWMPDQPWHDAKEEVTHVIGFFGNAKAKKALVCVDLFNLYTVATLLPFSGEANCCHVYAVDILEGENTSAQLVESVFAATPWQATHKNGDEQLNQNITQRLSRLIESMHRRTIEQEGRSIVADAFGAADETALTAAQFISLAENLHAKTEQEWTRPGTTVEDMESGMEQLASLMRDLSERVPEILRTEFAVAGSTLRSKLDRIIVEKRLSD